MDQFSTTEALYFRLFFSYLLRTPDLFDNHHMLLDQYQKYPESFLKLTRHDLLRIKQVQVDLKLGRYSLFSSSEFDLEPSETIKSDNQDKSHVEICMAIAKNRTLLKESIGPIDFINLEHPCRYGLIDILIHSNRTCWIIEVKTQDATHHIIGQIRKYYIAQCLELNLRFFDDVKMATLCPGYNPDTLKDLRSMGVKPLVFRGNPLEIMEL